MPRHTHRHSQVSRCLLFMALFNSTPTQNPISIPTSQAPFPIGPNPYLDSNRRGHFLLKESTVYSLQPLTKISNPWQTTKTWLIKLEELSSGKVIFKDPLFRFPFEDLKLPEVLNLLDYKVSEVSKAYGFEFVEEGNASELEFNEWKSTTLVKKVVVSSCLDEIDDGFAIMALHTRGSLGVWRIGDKSWNNVSGNHSNNRSYYEDIVYHNGKFYAIDATGLVISVDPASLQINELSNGCGYASGGRYKYLVKSLVGLFLVDKYYLDDFEIYGYYSDSDSDDNCPVPLEVYKFDEERRVWVEVDGLDDNVLFIGDDISFSISAKDCHGCKRNCVYHCDDSFSEAEDDHPGFDVGIFDLEDGIAGPLSKFPGYSKVFWPPPTWLKWKH